ncbi:MAG: thioredoxin domain-containing protein, partial [Deltaproteobacteria bacterium]
AWHRAAAEAATFLLDRATVDGRLMRTWKAGPGGGRAHVPAFADDHAFLVTALIDLYQGDFDPRWLRAALHLADQLVTLFWDDADGGLYYTGSDAEPLITRSKHMLGGAVPSANGVAALAFCRLSTLTGRTDLADKARAIVDRYRMLLDRAPRALGPEALAAAWLAGPTREIGIVGRAGADDTAALLAELRRRPLPFSVIARVDPDADAETRTLLPWMAGRVHGQEQATAYVCEGSACQLPARTPAALARRLDG